VIAKCFQRDPSNRPSASSLLNDDFFNGSIPMSPLHLLPEKESVTSPTEFPSPNISLLSKSPTPRRHLLGKLTDNEMCDTSLSDSLCYSLTLPVPTPKDKKQRSLDRVNGETDTSNWPQWAKNGILSKTSHWPGKENTAAKQSSAKGIGQNPFARSSQQYSESSR
jgi:serine/threonine protein kinase